MMKKIFVILCLLSTFPAFGQEQQDENSFLKDGEVNVVGKKVAVQRLLPIKKNGKEMAESFLHAQNVHFETVEIGESFLCGTILTEPLYRNVYCTARASVEIFLKYDSTRPLVQVNCSQILINPRHGDQQMQYNPVAGIPASDYLTAENAELVYKLLENYLLRLSQECFYHFLR